MKLYGIATKEDNRNLKCLPDLIPLIFTEYEMARAGCDENEEVVEIAIVLKGKADRNEADRNE